MCVCVCGWVGGGWPFAIELCSELELHTSDQQWNLELHFGTSSFEDISLFGIFLKCVHNTERFHSVVFARMLISCVHGGPNKHCPCVLFSIVWLTVLIITIGPGSVQAEACFTLDCTFCPLV